MLEFKEFSDTTGAVASMPDEPMPEIKDTGEMGDLASAFAESQEPVPLEMVTLAEKYGEEKRSIKAAENKIKNRKEALAKQEAVLYNVIEGLGIQSFSSKGYTYFTKIDSYASVDAARTNNAFAWIRGEGFGDIIKLTANARSLTSVVKEVFEITGERPEESDGINIRVVNRVGVRKKYGG